MATFWQLTSCIRRRSGMVCFAEPDLSNSPPCGRVRSDCLLAQIPTRLTPCGPLSSAYKVTWKLARPTRFERVTFAFGGQTQTTTLSSTDEQRFPDAASWEESLISIEAIVNAFMFLYGQLVIEVEVRTSREKW
jgi:hypothetical protein